MIDDQWYLQLVLKHGKIPPVTWEIHHVNAEGFCSTWFTAHDSCFCVCFQYVIQNCGSICHGGADWWAANKREESRDRTERREKLLTCHHTDKTAPRLKVDKLIRLCSGALLSACHCRQGFCLIFSMTTVPCGPPYIDLWALATGRLFPARSGWENWTSLDQRAAQHSFSFTLLWWSYNVI